MMQSFAADATALCDVIELAQGLQRIYRYHGKHHFTAETAQHDAAMAAGGAIRLESVADHCWHLNYIATLLAPYFPDLDQLRVQALITLHDILELITGDTDPTGSDGTGRNGHGLNDTLAAAKTAEEAAALDQYLVGLPTIVATQHRRILEEEMACTSDEARFVKVLDKMQCLFFIRLLKRRAVDYHGMQYSTDQMHKVLPLFPALAPLYQEALRRLRDDTAEMQVAS